jgi:hypothetical protein
MTRFFRDWDRSDERCAYCGLYEEDHAEGECPPLRDDGTSSRDGEPSSPPDAPATTAQREADDSE